MEKRVEYQIEGNIVKSVRKVLAHISDTDMRGNSGLTDDEIKDVHSFLDFTFSDEEEVRE